ncbi:MAG: hypothetical protein ABIN36_11205 [Ferruginibacter sp.]
MKKTFLFTTILLLCLTVRSQEPDQNEPVIRGNEAQHEGNEQQRADEGSDREAIDGAIGNLQEYMDWLEARRNEWNTVQNFDPNECSPDFAASGAAMMPSNCAGNQACSECYERAVGELNFIRRQLGRLSCIYSNTKNFNESAIAFGDNMSGIHAVTGAAWQSARGEIVGQFNSFKHTYDAKYTDMMGSLQRALQSVGSCEMQYGLPDWYQRFGFIYFEFMKDKYKRTD